MAILECSSQRKSDNFAHGRLYGREAIFHVINIMLSQPKGGLYEMPWLGFDRRDLLHYELNGDEYKRIQDELAAMIKEIIGVQDDVEVSMRINNDRDGVDVDITVRDNFGGFDRYSHTFPLDGIGNRYKHIKVK